jgi:hypothetical protein
VIFQLTGIADIMRGSSQASETLGAQEIKQAWGTMRLKRMQKEVQCRRISCRRSSKQEKMQLAREKMQLDQQNAQMKMATEQQAHQQDLQANAESHQQQLTQNAESGQLQLELAAKQAKAAPKKD